MIRDRFAPLMDGCRLMVDGHLMPLLAQLFDSAPSVLLEFADKAQSDSAQQGFFEAMRAIGAHRAAMENTVLEELDRQFRAFAADLPRPESGAVPDADDMLSLALVEQDALDEALALQNTVARAQVRYAQDLYGLRQRLALVVGGRKLEEEEIPAGPQQLAEGFRAAARALPLDTKTKLVVFVLFDRFVMTQLGDMYKEYNSRLIEQGLLPHLKYNIAAAPKGAAAGTPEPGEQARGEQAPAASPPEGKAGGHGATVAEETFEAICELLAGRHPSGSRRRRREGVATLSAPALASEIGRLEATGSGLPPPGELVSSIQIDAELIRKIKATLVEQRERLFVNVDRERMGGVDAEVIDLVGLIFEYMLNDDTLPNAVKALLSHLHTPFLKLAIVDKQFFTEENHPARQLLNAMIDAGARYVVETDLKRGIFPHLQSLVHRVRNEYEEGLELFEVLLAELRSREAQMRNIAEVTERRAREAATGQEKLEQARRRAAQVVDAGTRGRAIPPRMVELLQESLTDKLAFILLRDPQGEGGTVWQTALRLIRDVALSTVPPATDAARAEMQSQLPQLQARILTALETLGRFGGDDVGRLYHKIVLMQQAALSSTAADPGEDRITLEAEPKAAVTPPPAQREAATPPPASPEEERADRALDHLEFGTWFDFVPGGTEPSRRLKLAWYTPVAGRYMFVDSMGVQAAILPRQELARQMAAGRVRVSVPEKRPFFDRALEAVRRLLGGRKPVVASSVAA